MKILNFILFIFIMFSTTAFLPSQERIINTAFIVDAFNHAPLNEIKSALKIWVRNISVPNEIKVESETYPTLKEFFEAFPENKPALISLSSIDYCSTEKLKDYIPITTGSVHNSKFIPYVLAVHKSSSFQSIKNLKNKKIHIIGYGDGKIAKVWMNSLFIPETPESFFSSVNYVKLPTQAIFPLFFKQTDACIVSKQAFDIACELNPQIKTNTKILETSPLFLNTIVLRKIDLEEDIIQLIEDKTLNLHKDPAGKQLLMLFKNDRVVPYEKNDLLSIRELLQKNSLSTK